MPMTSASTTKPTTMPRASFDSSLVSGSAGTSGAGASRSPWSARGAVSGLSSDTLSTARRARLPTRSPTEPRAPVTAAPAPAAAAPAAAPRDGAGRRPVDQVGVVVEVGSCRGGRAGGRGRGGGAQPVRGLVLEVDDAGLLVGLGVRHARRTPGCGTGRTGRTGRMACGNTGAGCRARRLPRSRLPRRRPPRRPCARRGACGDGSAWRSAAASSLVGPGSAGHDRLLEGVGGVVGGQLGGVRGLRRHPRHLAAPAALRARAPRRRRGAGDRAPHDLARGPRCHLAGEVAGAGRALVVVEGEAADGVEVAGHARGDLGRRGDAAGHPGGRGEAAPTGAERPQPGQAGIGQGHDTHGVAAGGVLGLRAVLAGAHGGGLEAAQAHVAVGGAQHVVGLEVEVVHAALAGGLQGRRDLTGDAAHLVTGHPAVGDQLGQGAGLAEVLLDDVGRRPRRCRRRGSGRTRRG